MSIIDDLRNDDVWDSFLDKRRRKAKDYTDIMQMQSFIANRRYRPIVEAIAEERYVFKDPYMMEIPKENGSVRRVFSIRRSDDISEIIVLKVIGQLLKRYEKGFCPNLYSQSENGNVEGAMTNISRIAELEKKYVFKFDITDYGNSIRIDQLKVMLDDLMDESDRPIKKVLFDILSNPNVILRKNGEETHTTVEQKGVMTGFPFVHFLSGLYLNDMDWHYYNAGKHYYRFNDDIAIVCESMEEAEEQKAFVMDIIAKRGLTVNESKMQIIEPGQASGYLGIRINGTELTIMKKTVMKYKNKFKKRAKAIRRKINSREITAEHGLDLMIRYVMATQYGHTEGGYCFMNTYFTRITSGKGLSDVDHYAQQYIRYVYTGKYSKTNERLVPYDKLKHHGYVPLVSGYRIYRNG